MARTVGVVEDRVPGLLLGLASLQILDALTTTVVLRAGGSEANPIMATVADSFWTLVAVKAVCLAAVSVLALRNRGWIVTRRVLTAVVVGYLAIVAWNLTNLN